MSLSKGPDYDVRLGKYELHCQRPPNASYFIGNWRRERAAALRCQVNQKSELFYPFSQIHVIGFLNLSRGPLTL